MCTACFSYFKNYFKNFSILKLAFLEPESIEEEKTLNSLSFSEIHLFNFIILFLSVPRIRRGFSLTLGYMF